MNLDLTDDETVALLREVDALIDGDRYFMSPRIKTLRATLPRLRFSPGGIGSSAPIAAAVRSIWC
jgi:hypothetical protein